MARKEALRYLLERSFRGSPYHSFVSSLKGVTDDIGNDMSNGYIGSRAWFDA